MMVTFVSQCEKNSLKRTRQVLDAYANRIGDNVWQTIITEEGLLMVKKLLRRTASKNTAVSCHWIRSRRRSDLLWIVGNRQKFNSEGIVPVNVTGETFDKYIDPEKWQRLSIAEDAVVIAGLFHDFGKSSTLFQKKLKGEGRKRYEPIRHEWISLRIFQAFVGDKTDEEWLTGLTEINKNQIDILFRDGIDKGKNNPLSNLPPLAQLIGWLILSHHKLPFVPSWKKSLRSETKLEVINQQKITPFYAWFEQEFKVYWNSYNFRDDDLQDLMLENWHFSQGGLPYKSAKWRLRVIKAADKALENIKLLGQQNLLHDDLFTTHLARMALMLADHYYSSKDIVTERWQAPNYKVYANTDRITGELKQQLDEHLIGVSENAKEIIRALPKLKSELLSLENNQFLKNTKIIDERFAWQISAQKETLKQSKSSEKQGFFGINMASTGQGKTIANAKIMYALADYNQECRFTVALGLRTLTLQTGREYRKQLKLSDEELAIAVGGAAVKTLFENEQNKRRAEEYFGSGSESMEDFWDPSMELDYDLSRVEHPLYEWTKNNPRIEKLLQAPVLVCTIDHLMPATDGTKGGKQIGPMLRLLTSDLIIDEPDDFCLEDLPALCRLVHWAGMLGSRILLSTATMPPDLAMAAFQAYQSGWTEYAKTNIENWNKIINCAWFDERPTNGAILCEVKDYKEFRFEHENYVKQRVKFLTSNTMIKHKSALLDVAEKKSNVYEEAVITILKGALELHQNNYVNVDGKKVSIGLVRMANINPLVAVAKEIFQQNLPDNTHLHLSIYHSHYPLAVRSHLENQLDKMLNRKEQWPPSDLSQLIQNTESENQVFIVMASPVAEVGRDHDYDWAIIEPSSMRSIIQIAGRVLRHRDIIPESENIFLLNQNIRSLKGDEYCFQNPGFEGERLKLKSHQLKDVLHVRQYQNINAIERVIKPKDSPIDNLVALEHQALLNQLFLIDESAKVWWKEQVHWSGVLQRLQPFRESVKDESLYLLVKNDELVWRWKNESAYPATMGEISGSGIEINNVEIQNNQNITFWFDLDPLKIYQELSIDLGIDIEETARRFGELRLVSYQKNDINIYQYSKNFGVYQEVK